MISGCERSRQAPPSDSVAAPPPDSTPADLVPSTRGWDASAGAALFVPGASSQQAIVVFPEYNDSTLTDTTTFDLDRVRSTELDLFSRAGKVVPARSTDSTRAGTAAASCTAWPTVRLSPIGGGGGRLKGWSVAVAAGSATAIPLDSIEDDPPADSAKLAAEVTRLAAAIPNDTAPAFRGLPFTVLTARRFTPAPGVDAVVAQLVRRVNQEARPYEQHILVIGERDAKAGGRYSTAYFERVSGPEETIETSEILAALRLGAEGVPTIVLGRDYGDGTAYSLIERSADGHWRLRWSSAYAGC